MYDDNFSWRDEFYAMLFADDIEMEIERRAFNYRPTIRIATKRSGANFSIPDLKAYHNLDLEQEPTSLVRATPGSACWDLFAAEPWQLPPRQSVIVPTGLIFEIEPGYCVKIYPRSSMGKRGIIMPNSVGVIDADYRGEVGVLLMNTHDEATLIQRGERIAQFMVEKVLDAKFVQVTEEELTQTERGEGGFGSTGR